MQQGVWAPGYPSARNGGSVPDLRVRSSAASLGGWRSHAVAGEATRLDHMVVMYAVLLSTVQGTFIQDMMAATGLPGTLIDGVFWAPVLVFAARYGRVVVQGAALPWTVLIAYVSLSTLWSDQTLDALAKTLSMTTVVAWVALLSARPACLPTMVKTTLAVCVVSFAANLAGVTVMHPGDYFATMVALFGHLALRERSPTDTRISAAAFRMGLYGLLMAMVVLSTFRAAMIATAVGFLWCSRRSQPALIAAVLLAVAAGAYLAAAPPREQHYDGQIERSDLRGRLETMDEDRLSGREDIWENVLADVRTTPPWLLYGEGVGDVDMYVGWLNRDFAGVGRDGVRVEHTHNLLLEVLIATGIPGLVLLAWAFMDSLRRLRSDARAGVAMAAFIVCNAGVPIYDRAGGGTMFMGLLLVLLAAPATGVTTGTGSPVSAPNRT